MHPRAGAPGAVAARDRARREALALAVGEALVAPASAHRVWPVRSACGARFEAGPGVLEIPALAGCAGAIEALAACACSLGPRLEARVASLFRAHRALLALELDALGTAWLFALAERLTACIRREARRAGLRAGAALNPGDVGIALGEQRRVLALAQAASHAITATPQGMLRPAKSLCFVVALGRALTAPAGGRCARCRAHARCSVRPA
ncbi:MAG: hypothetical protein M5U08_12480 [Burkholderiales bacterium]|nr:hypothetical protein [Burkholderiales bacterium]